MKLILLLCLFCISVLGQSVTNSFTNGRPFFVSFTYPAADFPSNLTFRVHGSPLITSPVEAWPILTTNVAEIAGDSGLLRFETAQNFPVTLPVYFFAVSVSNEWGGPVFSEVFATAPPRTTGRVGLR